MRPVLFCVGPAVVGVCIARVRAIVGLGNPGPGYRNTRHNVGWMVVERLIERWRVPRPRRPRRGQKAQVVAVERRGRRVLLVKPLTSMNLSGHAVRLLAHRERLDSHTILLVYDDLDLALARVRLRPAGSAAGHGGVKSIIDRLGTNEFPRLRIGIGRPPGAMNPIDYVLTDFDAEQMPVIEVAIERAADAVEVVLDEGLAAAMNRFNG